MAIAEYGDPCGLPVLFCHGAPGSSAQITDAMTETAATLHIRLVVPDRDGYGDSANTPGRTLLDWPVRLSDLLDALKIDTFHVMGFSMGGMFALACAYSFPNRVASAVLISSVSPNFLHPSVVAGMSSITPELFTLARDNPAALKTRLAPFADTPEQLVALFAEPMPPPDKRILTRADITTMYLQCCAASLHNNAEGVVDDFALCVNDWGFSLQDVSTNVLLWQGADDRNVPLAAAQYLNNNLPHSSLRVSKGQGHMLLFDYWDEILLSIPAR